MDMNMTDRYRGAMLGLAVDMRLERRSSSALPAPSRRSMTSSGADPSSCPPARGLMILRWRSASRRASSSAADSIPLTRCDATSVGTAKGIWPRPAVASISAIPRARRCSGSKIQAIRGAVPMTTAPAGNGSIMRLAPVVLAFARSPSEAIAMAARSSRTTHGAPDAVDGCRYLAALLVGALRGASKEDLLGGVFEPLADVLAHEPLAPAITEVAAGSFRRRNPPAIRGTGHARSGAVDVPSWQVFPRWGVTRRQPRRGR
jgi:ADP-ribosylglycohydrolase